MICILFFHPTHLSKNSGEIYTDMLILLTRQHLVLSMAPTSLVCFIACHTGFLHYTEGTFLEQAKEVETSYE